MNLTPSSDGSATVVALGDEAASRSELAGAKAAALARSALRGLPTLDGFVITTRAGLAEGAAHRDDDPALARAWTELSAGGRRPLVVRSSSTGEDGVGSSMAGMFASVLDVRGGSAFDEAVDEVLRSRRRPGVPDVPMAVLVQPFLEARYGGVAFSADPITGRTDRVLVSVVEGGPDALVSGASSGWTASVSLGGRIDEARSDDGPRLPRRQLRAVAHLARRAEKTFGAPQDIEWAIDTDGHLHLLQSRPITTFHGKLHGPVLGPGPVAETFPEPLSPLERDLWLDPLRDGLRNALTLTGAASPRELRRSPVVEVVGGRAAVDLHLVHAEPPAKGFWRHIDPRPGARRLRAAWRVGRLTAALPALARDIAGRVDRDLADVPSVDELSNTELVAVLLNGRRALTTLHSYEAMAGLLVPPQAATVAAASLALSTLAQARADGIPSDEVVARNPLVLALLPPRIGGPTDLPAVDPGMVGDPVADGTADHPAAVAREGLRLRARWVQELTARAAEELGHRLAVVGVLSSDEVVRWLTLDELRLALTTRRAPAGLDERAAALTAEPLPAAFRVAEDGTPMPTRGTSDGAGVGAGGGTGRGPVWLGDDPPDGAVLVVGALDPRLAPVIGRLSGLVAETGSPLSHLAILARERGVPVVVGYRGARTQWTAGTMVHVDGTTGRVDAEPGAPAAAARDHTDEATREVPR